MSFNVMSEEKFEDALKVWRDFPAELTKDDVVSMELFFESLTAQVQKQFGKEQNTSLFLGHCFHAYGYSRYS